MATTNTDMNRTSTTGAYEQPSVSNNGGGPEPHQGSNPGAQSDPGPKEVGFYDTRGKHMGGDDGVQNFESTPAVRGSREDEGAMGKAKSFADELKDKAEEFFNTDFNQDGKVGDTPTGAQAAGSPSNPDVDTQMDGPNDPRTPATYPYNTHHETTGWASATNNAERPQAKLAVA